jgi:hypothetical protein
MSTQLRHLVAPLVLAGIIGGVSIQPAAAGTDGPRCHIEIVVRKMHYKPSRAEFIVHSPGSRGAVGVWKSDSGNRLSVRVDPGEGEASKWLSDVSRREYELVRCETV